MQDGYWQSKHRQSLRRRWLLTAKEVRAFFCLHWEQTASRLAWQSPRQAGHSHLPSLVKALCGGGFSLRGFPFGQSAPAQRGYWQLSQTNLRPVLTPRAVLSHKTIFNTIGLYSFQAFCTPQRWHLWVPCRRLSFDAVALQRMQRSSFCALGATVSAAARSSS